MRKNVTEIWAFIDDRTDTLQILLCGDFEGMGGGVAYVCGVSLYIKVNFVTTGFVWLGCTESVTLVWHIRPIDYSLVIDSERLYIKNDSKKTTKVYVMLRQWFLS